MDLANSTTITPNRERGQHLTFGDWVSIRIFLNLKYSYRRIAEELNCSPSTVMYEVKRGTGERKGSRGRYPIYSPKRGQALYETNRSRCHKPYRVNEDSPFVKWMIAKIRNHKWSIDTCVGYARKHKLFNEADIACTKTFYNAVWESRISLNPFDLPEALSRKKKRPSSARRNKRVFGRSIDERPEIASLRTECGHWEIDTVIGGKSGKESVVLTLVEKKTDYYIAIKIPGKNSEAVMAAFRVLREEYGEDKFKEVFKTITADNGSEFEGLSELEEYGVSVYFAHPYTSCERAQNERHNRIFRRYIPKGTSIEKYSSDQILWYADEMNRLPRKHLGYETPEKLFEEFLDQVYSIVNVHIA